MVDTHKFRAHDFLVCFFHFIDIGVRKVDRHVLSANIVLNVLVLCLIVLTRYSSNKTNAWHKFLHQVLWHSLAKLCMKNYENPSTVHFVKVTAKKIFLYGHGVCIIRNIVNKYSLIVRRSVIFVS